MSQKEKLVKKLLAQPKPKDFTIDELDTLCSKCGLLKRNRGKTSGFAIEYYNPDTLRVLKIHSPHPGKILKAYVIQSAIDYLRSEGKL